MHVLRLLSLFSNEKDMKTHKKKEPSHEYCHRCDVDCEDDAELLIHMIESDRHRKSATAASLPDTMANCEPLIVVCPICGIEFKSNGGLESHISQVGSRSVLTEISA